MALGAFLAGLMLGETEFRHQIDIDIRPFRDVLLGLFFITIGALMHIKDFPLHWHWVLVILVSLIALKTLLIMGLTRLIGGVSLAKSFRTGLILAQGGEFGFVILTVAINNQLIDPAQSQVVVAAVVLSIMVAPFLIRYNKNISNWVFRKLDVAVAPPEEQKSSQLSTHAAELKDHVIICGFGRVGQILARFLEQENIPSVALDLDPIRISASVLAGLHAFFGDARRPEFLAAAGLARARMVVISFADEPAALETLRHIRALRLDVPVFVRTRNDSNLEEFQKAGATEVVPESLEASLMLASHLLLMLGVPASRILFKIRAIHADRYRVIQGFFKGTDDIALLEEEDASRMSLHALTVPENAFAVDKTLEDMSLPETPYAIKVLTRGNTRYPDPPANMIIQAGDVLVLYATPELLYLLEERITSG
jgi:CPA2 family monovalent cation:H+ antiporter-2